MPIKKRSCGPFLKVALVMAVLITGFASGEEDIALEGGDTTISDITARSYDHPLANLSSSKDLQRHALGSEGFHRNFSRSPIEGKLRIGPKFNDVS